MVDKITFAGAVDDIDGVGVGVHQDRDGIRIDIGQIEVMFDGPTAHRLIAALHVAIIDAALWSVMADEADDE